MRKEMDLTLEDLLIIFGLGIFIGVIVSKAATSQPALQKPVGQIYMNEETWHWVDWRGRERQITVHRRVKVDE